MLLRATGFSSFSARFTSFQSSKPHEWSLWSAYTVHDQRVHIASTGRVSRKGRVLDDQRHSCFLVLPAFPCPTHIFRLTSYARLPIRIFTSTTLLDGCTLPLHAHFRYEDTVHTLCFLVYPVLPGPNQHEALPIRKVPQVMLDGCLSSACVHFIYQTTTDHSHCRDLMHVLLFLLGFVK